MGGVLFVSQSLYRIQLGGLGGGVPTTDDADHRADDEAKEDPQPRNGEGRFHEDGQNVADPYPQENSDDAAYLSNDNGLNQKL